mmetsp:Transcript_74726/g.173067  ORF Transcript_74726/g.173067 Transcript_74726/m.173067 type:complete len:111 (+) Transcript_74726:245-577(+)
MEQKSELDYHTSGLVLLNAPQWAQQCTQLASASRVHLLVKQGASMASHANFATSAAMVRSDDASVKPKRHTAKPLELHVPLLRPPRCRPGIAHSRWPRRGRSGVWSLRGR